MENWTQQSIVLIPAFNEEAALGPLLDEIAALFPDLAVAVINDCSADGTAAVARAHGALVLDLPCNLGVGGAMQTGFAFACARGFRYAIRLDGDGQHPPEGIPQLFATMRQTGADVVIGSRFLGHGTVTSSPWRNLGIRALSALLSYACRQRITDPTSGFQLVNAVALRFFAATYPADYPEPESLALLTRQGYGVAEAPAAFRVRQGGCSSIGRRTAFYYVLTVILALLVDRARAVNPRLARQAVAGGAAR
jgi:glycosyltransferase involved in cell wall biosynthesis